MYLYVHTYMYICVYIFVHEYIFTCKNMHVILYIMCVFVCLGA